MREEILKSEWNRDESPLALYARGVFLILGNHIHPTMGGSTDQGMEKFSNRQHGNQKKSAREETRRIGRIDNPVLAAGSTQWMNRGTIRQAAGE